MKPPIDLDKLYADFVATIGSDRGDEHRLHGSDLGGCDYATYLRLKGEPRMPFDDDTIHRFYMGHMVEKYVAGAIQVLEDQSYVVKIGNVIDSHGVIGHLDFEVIGGGHHSVIDVTTTRGKEAKPMYSHALKSAFYAEAVDADRFCEWVFKIGYGGKVQAPVAYWFDTEDFLKIIDDRVKVLQAIEFDGLVPAIEPPQKREWDGTMFVLKPGERDTWKCRAYCNAPCPRNEKAGAFNKALEEIGF